MHLNIQKTKSANSVGTNSYWFVYLPVVMCFVILTSGCGQQRYQPAKWRPGLRQSESKTDDGPIQGSNWSTLPIRGNGWGTLPRRPGSTLPQRGGTLPFRNWSTLPNSTMPNRGGMSTLPRRNWEGSTLPQRRWDRRPIPGINTLPRMNTLPRRKPEPINFQGRSETAEAQGWDLSARSKLRDSLQGEAERAVNPLR